MHRRSQAASVQSDEIDRFSGLAEDWWNPDGKFRPLHRLNPVRLTYVRDQICAHFGRAAGARDALKGLNILDIGCGGGLMCEPLARLGATVTGLDASEETIEVAAAHARRARLSINYRCGSIEAEAKRKERYDVITVLEVVEHVADLDSFVTALKKLLKPKGLLIFSTLNRTPKSFLLGIVAAEYILGWVPRGTHQWTKFIRPSELIHRLEEKGLRAGPMAGLAFNPLRGTFEISDDDFAVNYFLTAENA